MRPMPQPTSSTLDLGSRPAHSTRWPRNSSPTAAKSPSPTNCRRRGGTSGSRSRRACTRSLSEGASRNARVPYAPMSDHRLPERDKPWMMRTYSGHSSARASNELYRTNRAKGQTGLSIAFDLPTQTGYDPDHELARGEVGKVGVPIAHKGDMHTL